jgi:hypothetical protein
MLKVAIFTVPCPHNRKLVPLRMMPQAMSVRGITYGLELRLFSLYSPECLSLFSILTADAGFHNFWREDEQQVVHKESCHDRRGIDMFSGWDKGTARARQWRS